MYHYLTRYGNKDKVVHAMDTYVVVELMQYFAKTYEKLEFHAFLTSALGGCDGS